MENEIENLIENRSVFHSEFYSVDSRESACGSGIIIDVWERDGDIVKSFQFLNDDLCYTMADKEG